MHTISKMKNFHGMHMLPTSHPGVVIVKEIALRFTLHEDFLLLKIQLHCKTIVERLVVHFGKVTKS